MQKNPKFLNKHLARGFTLIELLLVLVILAILAGVVLPKFTGKSKQAKITAAQTQIGSLKMALDNFEIDNGSYPKSGDLGSLVSAPANLASWKGPYIENIPADPWGNAYIYEYPGKHTSTYDLSSPGPDGRPGTDDDVTNWDTNTTGH